MVVRSLLTFLAVTLLGATLMAPAVFAPENGAGASKSFKAPLSDWATLPTQLSDTDGEDADTPLAVTLELPAPHRPSNTGPIQPMVIRFAELPPARASPVYL